MTAPPSSASAAFTSRRVAGLARAPVMVSSPRIKAQDLDHQVVSNAAQAVDVINEQERHNFKLGALLLVVAIATWMLGLELVNSVLKGDQFQKPFFMATLTGSCFMLNWIPNVARFVSRLWSGPVKDAFSDSPLLSSSDLDLEGVGTDAQNPNYSEAPHSAPSPLDRLEVLALAFQISIIYYVYNLMGMLALKYTSASNQTILGSTTTFFTLLLGTMLKIDRLTSKKVVCVMSSLLGVVLINVGERSSGSNDSNKFMPKNPALGNTFALAGAFCYALYLLVMKLKCGTGDRTTNERELFGWVGIFTFLMGVPLLFTVHLLDIEKFSLPPSRAISAMVLINSVFSVISDYVTIIAMLLTSPLVTSLALTSSIPITIFVDFLILRLSAGSDTSKNSGFFVYAFGVASILTSVLLINIDITSENELIEEVIDGAFEGAIKNDDVLSPLLSPYLSSSTTTGRHSPLNRVGLRHLSPRLGFFLSTDKSTGSCVEVSKLALNATSSGESSNLKNANHHQHLYTLDSQLSGTATEPALHISGGVNHNFIVSNVD